MSKPNKPQAIVRFERAYLAGAAAWLGAVIVKLSVVGIPPNPSWPFAALAFASVMAIYWLYYWFFWFFIARRGSNLVRWLLCVLVVCGLIDLPNTWVTGMQVGPAFAALSISVTILPAVALLLLCGRGANLWLSHKGRIPESTTDVFG